MGFTKLQREEKDRLFSQGLKRCPKCPEPKLFFEFGSDKRNKDGFQGYCKEHTNENNRRLRQKNRDKINSRIRKTRKKFPWKILLTYMKQRCSNPNDDSYKWYGDKGIRCLITENELKKLWFRDKAYLMNKPSIDRKNSKKDYTFDNCQFLELTENTAKDKRKIVLQYDLNMKFIKEWVSTREIERKISFAHTNISACCLGKYKQAYGFIWRYKNDR